jgi:hypothetical protein
VQAVIIVLIAATARAQSPISTLTLGSDEIGLVKTAQGITTRISFPEKVIESICGDLYDPTSGKGTFVIQNSGNDVFLKPIASRGTSNLFVKIGSETRSRIYNFDLTVVATPKEANRVVNVVVSDLKPADLKPADAAKSNGTPEDGANTVNVERIKNEAEAAARIRGDEIIRNARQQADRMTGEAEAKLLEADRQIQERADRETHRRFVQALMLGLKEVKLNNSKAVTKKRISMSLDPRLLVFNEKGYIRYTIQNTGEEEFRYSAIIVEQGTEEEAKPLVVEVIQSKPENLLARGESLTGIIAFDATKLDPKSRLTLYLRSEDNAEIARVNIQR